MYTLSLALVQKIGLVTGIPGLDKTGFISVGPIAVTEDVRADRSLNLCVQWASTCPPFMTESALTCAGGVVGLKTLSVSRVRPEYPCPSNVSVSFRDVFQSSRMPPCEMLHAS
jgi:hypothetical protein